MRWYKAYEFAIRGQWVCRLGWLDKTKSVSFIGNVGVTRRMQATSLPVNQSIVLPWPASPVQGSVEIPEEAGEVGIPFFVWKDRPLPAAGTEVILYTSTGQAAAILEVVSWDAPVDTGGSWSYCGGTFTRTGESGLLPGSMVHAGYLTIGEPTTIAANFGNIASGRVKITNNQPSGIVITDWLFVGSRQFILIDPATLTPGTALVSPTVAAEDAAFEIYTTRNYEFGSLEFLADDWVLWPPDPAAPEPDVPTDPPGGGPGGGDTPTPPNPPGQPNPPTDPFPPDTPTPVPPTGGGGGGGGAPSGPDAPEEPTDPPPTDNLPSASLTATDLTYDKCIPGEGESGAKNVKVGLVLTVNGGTGKHGALWLLSWKKAGVTFAVGTVSGFGDSKTQIIDAVAMPGATLGFSCELSMTHGLETFHVTAAEVFQMKALCGSEEEE